MILTILREKAGTFAFVLAAGFAPLTTLIPSSCGVACGGCPLSGGCLAIPAVAVGIGAFSFGPRIRAMTGRILGKAPIKVP